MAESLDNSIECFVDPDEEIFFGPITEREREIRKRLPRRTLHPNEVAELTKRGMSYQEWEIFKECEQRNQLNDEAISQVYGGHESSTDSFNSCDSSSENNSQDEILNDTWEMQEQMLAMAERLERGEDIPELGIHHSIKEKSLHQDKSEENEESKEVSIKNVGDSIKKSGDSTEIIMDPNTTAASTSCQLSQSRLNASHDLDRTPKVELSQHIPENLGTVSNETSDNKIKEEVTEMAEIAPDLKQVKDDIQLDSLCGSLTPFKLEESVSSPRKRTEETPILLTYPQLTPNVNNSSLFKTPTRAPLGTAEMKQRSTPHKVNSAKKPTPSPVGLYIHGGPEPVLIENVRPIHKKLIYSNPSVTRQKIAIKNAQGRWSIDTRRSSASSRSSTSNSKENAQGECDSNIKPVLPVVLHEAAATITQEPNETAGSVPWSRGKIAKLLERNPTPTVLKHQGRVKMNKSEALRSPKVVQSNIAEKSAYQPTAVSDTSLMDVSILQEVATGNQRSRSGIPVRRPNFNAK